MSEENTNLRNGRQPRTRDELSGALRYAYDELTHLKSENEELNRKLSALEMADNIVMADLRSKIDNLKTVMIAAAEEIQAHWQAHCDAEGYGPSNLMHRLEKGIPAQYGYTAGAFTKMEEELSRLKADCKTLEEHKEGLAGDLMKAWKENDRLKAENEELKSKYESNDRLWNAEASHQEILKNNYNQELERLKAERERVIETCNYPGTIWKFKVEKIWRILNHKDGE